MVDAGCLLEKGKNIVLYHTGPPVKVGEIHVSNEEDD